MESFPEELNRKLTLSQWILKFDKHLLSNPQFYECVKEYFYDSYRQCADLRKEFHNTFLPELDSNLGFPSSKEYYKYENFFKTLDYTKFDLSNFYFYNDDLNLYKKNNTINTSKTIRNKDNNKQEVKNWKYADKNKEMEIINNKNKLVYNKNNRDNIINKAENNLDEKNLKEENNYVEKKKNKDIKLFKKKPSKNQNKKLPSKNITVEFLNDNDDSMSNNNIETYGKQIDDSEEFSDSKEFKISNKSIKNVQEKNGNKNPSQKVYFSKKLNNIGNKGNNINKEESRGYNGYNKKNIGKININNNFNHKHSKSSYDVYKKFHFGKK